MIESTLIIRGVESLPPEELAELEATTAKKREASLKALEPPKPKRARKKRGSK